MGGNSDSQRYYHFPPSESRILTQFKKVYTFTMPGNRIPRINNQFTNNGLVPAIREGSQDSEILQGNAQQELYIDFRVNETLGTVISNNSSSNACSLTASQSATIASSGAKIEEVLSEHSETESFSTRGANVVDRKSSLLKRKGASSTTLQPSANADRCLKKGMGAVCRGIRTGGQWSKQEQELHINVLELLAVKLALLTFTKMKDIRSIHFQIDNKTALCYLIKMGGGTASQSMNKLSKEIWGILLKQNRTISAEYLPSALNQEADWESRHNSDPSDWKLCPHIFRMISCHFGHPDVDLFASRLCHQMKNYLSWKPDPFSKGTDAMQHTWSMHLGRILYAFPPFSLVPRVLNKLIQDQVQVAILITPVWQTQTWYPGLLQLLIANPIILPQSANLLTNAKREQHPLVENQTLQLAAWKVSGNPLLIQAFQDQLPRLSPAQEGQAQTLIMTRPGGNGLAGVLGNKLIRFSVL